jgi:hypothetical protein
MTLDVDSFLAGVAGFSSMAAGSQNELLAYHLQSNGSPCFSVAEVDGLRTHLKLPRFNSAHHFSVNSRRQKGKRPRFVKADTGYSLERGVFEDLHKKYGKRATAVAIQNDLLKHLGTLTDADLKEYLAEAVNCFGSGYFRAAIVMGWCAGYAILRAWLFRNHVGAVNVAMSSWKTPKRIAKMEDFDELGERVVLDTARAAAVLTKEQHKQLVALLDQRNSFAHPSGRKVAAPIAEAYLRMALIALL